MTLETITDNFRDGCARLEPYSLIHADELMAEQVRNKSLRKGGFCVADFPLYSLENGVPTIWLARHTCEEPNNLVIRHLFDNKNSSYNQIIKSGNFRPEIKEAREVMSADSTLKIDMTKLRLTMISNLDHDWYCLKLVINEKKVRLDLYDSWTVLYSGELPHPRYVALNDEEQALVERFYGSGDDFAKSIEMLRTERVNKTHIFVLDKYSVTEKCRKGPIGSVVWCADFKRGNGSILANNTMISDCSSLRGVLARKKCKR